MDYEEMKKTALRVQHAYDKLNIKKGEHVWDYREYAEGLVGDVGDLMKMIMAKSNLRGYSGDLDHDIKHEIADCVWSLIVIAEKLKIDLPKEFVGQMTTLAKKVEKMSE